MFGKKDNMEVKTGEKKKSKKKTILIVVVVLFLFLAIAGSDDNQSKNTVATSTDVVETGNTDTNNNSVAEISDVSFTGMRFNKSWSELKPELEKYSPKWASDKSYYDKENITEHIMNYNSNTENAYQINFIVEDKTDKIIGMYLAFLKQINDKDRDKAMDMWENILGEFGKSVVDQQLELLDKLLNDETPVHFKDNKYMCITESNQYYLFYALASNEEEANYHKENGIWRKMKDQQTEKNPDVMDGITEEDYIASNQERTGEEESQKPTTKDNDTSETTDKKNTNNKDSKKNSSTTDKESSINKALLQLTTFVEGEWQGHVKYDSYEYYKTSKSGIDVYKIKYTTSNSSFAVSNYYYQLVSFKNDYTEIDRTTKLFLFTNVLFEGEKGEIQEMEYAYKTTFDNYYEEVQKLYE